MTPDEATVALYKCIDKNDRDTTLEDVKRYVEAGARLRDVETLYGPPLLHALNNLCKIPILKYLIEKGGIDWSYKKGRYIEYAEDEPWFYIDCITYHTFKNELIRIWHYCNVTFKVLNQELINMFKIHAIPEEKYKEYLLKVPTEYDEDVGFYDDYMSICKGRKYRYGETYLEELCELFSVTPEELENGILELPDSIFDTSLLPVEDKPYCWNHVMDTSHNKPRAYFMYAGIDIEVIYNEDSKQSDTEESSEECTVTTSNV
jgi:hypothetical protein